MNTEAIYLDYAAATPVDNRVITAMAPYLSDTFYNPSASYLSAQKVRDEIIAARQKIAVQLAVKPSEIIITAGATESIALAIRGALESYEDGEILYSAIEHDSVRKLAESKKSHVIRVGSDGAVDQAHLSRLVNDSTIIISIGLVNSETGSIQDFRSIARLVQAFRADRTARGVDRPLYLHTDASQAMGMIDISPSRLGVDLLTLNAAKAYGPKQVGLLYVKKGTKLTPLFHGGGQENGMRSGTENVAGIIGMSVAFAIVEMERAEESVRLEKLRALAVKTLSEYFPNIIINGNSRKHSPHILNFSLLEIDGERLLMELDERGIMVATGSACAANKGTGSHVLAAIGLEEELIRGSIRLSFGKTTTESTLAIALENIKQCVEKQRGTIC